MAESFGNTIFTVPFPNNIPYLSYKDIHNYAPHSSRREEEEYLFSPFSDIKPFYTKNDPFFPRGYTLIKKEVQYSTDKLPSDINENLRKMAKNILKYQENSRIVKDLVWREKFDTDYKRVLSENEEIRESYKKASEEVLNFIAYQCAKLNKAHKTSDPTGN